MSNSEESEIKVTNDGWVIIFKDDNENIPQTLIDDIIRKHKHIHAIFTLQKELLQQTRVKKFLDNFTGKIYVYNYCNDLEHAYLVADACEMIATKPDVELLYHIPVTFPESKQPMKDDELKYEPTTSEVKTTQIVYAFAEQYNEAQKAYLKELGEQEGVHLMVFEQAGYSDSMLSKLIRGMSAPQLVLFFNVRHEQKEKIINILRKNDVKGLVTFANAVKNPIFDPEDKKLNYVVIPSINSNDLANSYDPNKATETASLTMSFEEAIQVAKRGVPVRALDWPVQSFIGVTDGQVVLAENIWSKHNRAFAEQNGGSAMVYNSFTKNVNGVITMGWIPTNADLWDTWVVYGTALYPQKIMLSEDLNEVAIDFSLAQGKGLYSDSHAFAGPFHLFYDTIFEDVKQMGKTLYITQDSESKNNEVLQMILDLMVIYHSESGEEQLSVPDVVDEYEAQYVDLSLEFNIGTSYLGEDPGEKEIVEYLPQFIEDCGYTSALIDLDSFKGRESTVEALVKALGLTTESNPKFSWVGLSLKENTVPYVV